MLSTKYSIYTALTTAGDVTLYGMMDTPSCRHNNARLQQHKHHYNNSNYYLKKNE